MALDEKLREQLSEARAAIAAQLAQLEGANMDPYAQGGAPDSRSLYSELQRELDEIDTLLKTDGHDARVSKDGESGHEPMTRLSADGSVGIPTGPTRAATVMAIVGVAMMIVWIGLLLLSG